MADDWECDAYGPDGRDVGALCFLAGELNARVCASHAECSEAMAAERQRVFRRIQEKAAAGDPDFVFLAGEFTNPGQILGGGQTGEDGSDE